MVVYYCKCLIIFEADFLNKKTVYMKKYFVLILGIVLDIERYLIWHTGITK